VSLEQDPLSLVRIIELLERKSSSPGLESKINGCGDPLHSPRDTPLPSKVATNLTDGRLMGIVHLRTKGHGVCLFVRRMASSGMLRHVALIRTDVLEELSPLLHQGDKNR
jgi:hypothetical protein